MTPALIQAMLDARREQLERETVDDFDWTEEDCDEN